MTAQKSSVLMARILPVGYDRTRAGRMDGCGRFPCRTFRTVRPPYAQAGPTCRKACGKRSAARLGGPIVAARSAGGGFTRAFAAVLDHRRPEPQRLRQGRASAGPDIRLVRPGSVDHRGPARSRGRCPPTLDDGRFGVLRPVPARRSTGTYRNCRGPCRSWTRPSRPGRPPRRRWPAPRPSCSRWACPPCRTSCVARCPGGRQIAARRAPLPSTASHTLAADRLDELAALERALPELAAGTGMLHGDLRVDNVLIERGGRAWLCDWTWPCLGAPWFDTVTLLVSAYAGGHRGGPLPGRRAARGSRRRTGRARRLLAGTRRRPARAARRRTAGSTSASAAGSAVLARRAPRLGVTGSSRFWRVAAVLVGWFLACGDAPLSAASLQCDRGGRPLRPSSAEDPVC